MCHVRHTHGVAVWPTAPLSLSCSLSCSQTERARPHLRRYRDPHVSNALRDGVRDSGTFEILKSESSQQRAVFVHDPPYTQAAAVQLRAQGDYYRFATLSLCACITIWYLILVHTRCNAGASLCQQRLMRASGAFRRRRVIIAGSTRSRATNPIRREGDDAESKHFILTLAGARKGGYWMFQLYSLPPACGSLACSPS